MRASPNQTRDPAATARPLAVQFLAASLLILAASSTGCARGNRAEAGPSGAGVGGAAEKPADPMLAAGYRSQWKGYPQVDARAGVKSIDVLGDVVAVHDNANILTVMEPGTGRNRWSLDLGSPLLKFVGNARMDDKLFACSESEIQVLDVRTGAVKGRQRLSALANTPPIIHHSIAIFGCSTGEVLGHNLATGYKLWAYKLGGTIKASPVIVGESVAAVSQAGDVILLNPQNGESYGRRLSIFGGLDNNPTAGESSLVLAGTDQSIWSISEDGKQNWRVRTPDRLSAQPVVVDGKAIVYVPSTGLTCFDLSGGATVWQSKDVNGTVIAVRNGKLVVWDPAAKSLLTLDPARGDVIERAPLPDAVKLTVDQFTDGNLYVANRDGSVDKYSPR